MILGISSSAWSRKGGSDNGYLSTNLMGTEQYQSSVVECEIRVKRTKQSISLDKVCGFYGMYSYL